AKIAAEKAGIIKPGVPAVIGRRHEEYDEVFLTKAGQNGSPICWAVDCVKVERTAYSHAFQTVDIYVEDKLTYKDLRVPLPGIYQRENIATVVAAVERLRKTGSGIRAEALCRGIERVITNTGLHGRWQVLSEKPLNICDTGQNEDGRRKVGEQLAQMPAVKKHVVIGMVSDKNVNKVLQLLPKDGVYYFTRASIPRSLDPVELRDIAGKYGLKGDIYPDVKSAVEAAKIKCGDNDLIFIGGSTFVVAEVVKSIVIIWSFFKSLLYLHRFLRKEVRALSSAGSEHLVYTQRVSGSNPLAPTGFGCRKHSVRLAQLVHSIWVTPRGSAVRFR